MQLITHYCIHCQRHFIGKNADKVAKRHMREAHNKRGTYGRGNIRVTSIEVQQERFDRNTVHLVDFEGTIEVCYTPVEYVDSNDTENSDR